MFLIIRIDSLKDRHILVVCYIFLAAPQVLWKARKDWQETLGSSYAHRGRRKVSTYNMVPHVSGCREVLVPP